MASRVYDHVKRLPLARDSREFAAREGGTAGAGEVFVNSVDRDGSKQGYDLELAASVSSAVHIPVVICGGVWTRGPLRAGAQASKRLGRRSRELLEFHGAQRDRHKAPVGASGRQPSARHAFRLRRRRAGRRPASCPQGRRAPHGNALRVSPRRDDTIYCTRCLYPANHPLKIVFDGQGV